jgi:dTDP-4-amino-4,6-dideoxygalactose transaminase
MTDTLTSLNSILEEFEKEIAKYVGTRYVILCSSGRTAIRLSLLALGIGHGDKVVIPDFACQILPITVFCVGAVPRFCDIDRQTLALSSAHFPKVLEPNTKAVIFAPLFGLPVDPYPILEIATEKGIAFIDDSAQALGTEIKGKKAGSFGNVGILSFYKSLDVDLGAAVTTNDEELATKIKYIREKYESKSFFATIGYRLIEFSRLKSRRIMKTIFRGDKYLQRLMRITERKHFRNVDGWVEGSPYVLESWRSNVLTTDMTNQLMSYYREYSHKRKLEKTEIVYLKNEFDNLERYLQDRRRIAKMYDELIVKSDLSKFIVPTNSAASYIRYPVLFSDRKRLSRCIRKLTQAGFHIDGRYEPLHESPFFGEMNKSSGFKESIFVSEHILPLPVTRLKFHLEKAHKVASIVNSNSFGR